MNKFYSADYHTVQYIVSYSTVVLYIMDHKELSTLKASLMLAKPKNVFRVTQTLPTSFYGNVEFSLLPKFIAD